jgi:hypothetical protein
MGLRRSTEHVFSAEQLKTGWLLLRHARHKSWSADCFRFTPLGDPDNDRITGGGGEERVIFSPKLSGLSKGVPDYLSPDYRGTTVSVI